MSALIPTLFPVSLVELRPHVGPDARRSVGTITVRLGNERPDHAVYVRRRLVVGLIIVGLCAVIGVSARTVLADRGGVPASIPTIRLATSEQALAPQAEPPTPAAPGVAAPAHLYIVQPGDTLWSLAELFHGSLSVSGYVDALVAANKGASLQLGQLLTLP